MSARTTVHGLRTFGLALIAGCAIVAPTLALAQGHGGGGGHGGFGGAHVGYAGHGFGGYRGGYGYRGYGGYYGRGYGWGGYGWGGYGWWGWPGGLFLATLPLYYSTLWWDGVPYYYAYDNYYTWDGTSGGYVAVTPPPQIAGQAGVPSAPQGSYGPPPGSAPGGGDLFAYPKSGQSAEQQARDRQECRDWAAAQSGAAPGNRGDNLRAQTACLEARGYSVR
jgi:hypothetical protein